MLEMGERCNSISPLCLSAPSFAVFLVCLPGGETIDGGKGAGGGARGGGDSGSDG